MTWARGTPNRKRSRSHWRLAPWAQDFYGGLGLVLVTVMVLYGMLWAFGR